MTRNGTRQVMPALMAAIMLGMPLAAAAQDFDLVISNGRVIDPETMLDAVLNVGVACALTLSFVFLRSRIGARILGASDLGAGLLQSIEKP